MFDITQKFNQRVLLDHAQDQLGRYEVLCHVKMMQSGLRGWFQIRTEALGKIETGGLWFNRNDAGQLELMDYNGVVCLPDCVTTVLAQQGVVIPENLL
jgi:hypothetical protein